MHKRSRRMDSSLDSKNGNALKIEKTEKVEKVLVRQTVISP